ncbi:uncharacterized protein EV154DRAFT_549615 [Mucor mucedo]|uniref:uncharacterized protein n=1 Tax=Mucor mucedo TaxID=29922 RepID=UPI00221F8638|nr:uncharacterized protein EV154DRAFT_549615 [Mucor mucedo]KAI7893693.1 hypothetical protein EV154DRAFT_549615 [Mucor mucedo]
MSSLKNIKVVRPRGIEPRPSPWKGEILPLNQERFDVVVKPVNVDGSDASKNHVTSRVSPTRSPDLDVDMPLEIELRLKKTKNQKRRFVPVKNNHMNRKRPKPNNTT